MYKTAALRATLRLWMWRGTYFSAIFYPRWYCCGNSKCCCRLTLCSVL